MVEACAARVMDEREDALREEATACGALGACKVRTPPSNMRLIVRRAEGPPRLRPERVVKRGDSDGPLARTHAWSGDQRDGVALNAPRPVAVCLEGIVACGEGC